MALREVVRQLGIHVGLFGRGAMTQEMQNIERRLEAHRTELSKTRTAYLFLAFGLLATGGIMTRFGRQLSAMSDQAIASFQGLEFQGTVVTTILGETGEAVNAVRQEMLRLGIETEFTAVQAGQAMAEFARAGFTLNETLGATGPALKLATAGLTTVTEAANIGVGVFRGFGFSVDTASEATQAMTLVVSELAQASVNSAATVTMLGEALKFVAPAAETLGIALSETLAVLMLAADAMVRAGIAGRALRMSFINLARAQALTTGTTRSLKDLVNDLGLEFVDQQGQLLSIADIVDMLNERFKDLAETERVAAIQTLFGTRAITLWSVLLREGGDAIRENELGLKAAAAKEAIFNQLGVEGTAILQQWRNEIGAGETALKFLTEEMGFQLDVAMAINDVLRDATLSQEDWNKAVRDAAGISEITAERLKTLQGTMLILQASIDAMWASIGQELAPSIKLWNRLLTVLADFMSRLPGPVRWIIGVFILFAGVLLMNVGQVLMLVGSVTMLIAAMAALTGTMKGNITASMLVTFAWSQLRIAGLALRIVIGRLAFAFGKLLLRIMLIVGFVLLLEHAWKKFGFAGILLVLSPLLLITAIRMGMWVRQGRRMIEVLRLLSARISMYTIKLFGATIGHKILTAASLVAAGATRVFGAALSFISAHPIVLALIGIAAAIAFVVTHWDQVVAAAQAFWEWLNKLIQPLQMIAAFILGTFGQAFQFIRDLISGIVDSIKWLIDVMVSLGGWFMTLIGQSVIPEAVESGAARIQKALSELGGDVRAEFGITRPGAPAVPAGGGGRTTIFQPTIQVTFSNVTFGGGPEQMVTVDRVTRRAVDEALKRFENEMLKQ